MEPEVSAPPLLPSAPAPVAEGIAPAPVPPPPNQPQFWEYMNEADREAFNHMRTALSSPACKHRRHHSTELNHEILNWIKKFVVRNDQDDWRRALVCGICWMPDGIAINTRQLRILLSKCKSSINALFQNLGYHTIPASNEFASSLVRIFPNLKDNFPELRKWTPRIAGDPVRPAKKRAPIEPVQAAIAEIPTEVEPPLNQADEPLPPLSETKKEEPQ